MENDLEAKACFDCRFVKYVVRPGLMPGYFWCELKHIEVGKDLTDLADREACAEFKGYNPDDWMDEGGGD